MKVGILTFHNSVNFGAALQAYATQEALLDLGVEAELIDYTNSERQKTYSIRYLIHRSWKSGFGAVIKVLIGTPLIILRKKKFHKFLSENCNLTEKKFHTPNQLKSELPKYDYYMVGSDQVWHPEHNCYDMSYMLDFVSEKEKTISYASSFGLESIPEELRDNYSQCLKDIHSISVREKTGADIVESLIGSKPPVLLDPVFLLSRERWQHIAKCTYRIDEPYLLLYTTKATYYDDFLRATKYDNKDYHLAYLTTSPRLKDILNPKTKLVFTSSPQEFLELIAHAKLVLTSSFHGTALSIIFHKQFVSFLSNNKGKDARIVDLLSQLGIKDRIFHKDMTQEQVDKQIDYEIVQNKLENLREKSLSFLQQALALSVKDKYRG